MEVQNNRSVYQLSGKRVTVYPSAAPAGPAVYLNSSEEEEEQICQALEESGCPDITLVTVSGLDWNRDMAPWDMPSAFKGAPPCTGGADGYLRLLTREIVPTVENALPEAPVWRGLAGYSLAGLFALYALYRTSVFSRAASISGSLWFADFREYVLTHEMTVRPECLYLSLGDRECRTRNPYLKTVQERTEEIAAHYAAQGIDTRFQLNPGNHFKNAVRRTAAGISWIVCYGASRIAADL